MDATNVTPSFGGKTKNDQYYRCILDYVAALRPTSSQADIAAKLTKEGHRTPRGLPFNRQRLANFLRNTSTN